MPEPAHHPSSYRDPSGFVFQHEGVFYRQIDQSYAADYTLLMTSGLYNTLVEKKWLIAHRELSHDEPSPTLPGHRHKTLLPAQLDVITYPYEWCFGQLKDAALHTLEVLTEAMSYGMILKDASPFNIQFVAGKPVFIDTLSFEKYDDSLPWVAYRQFCESFLFPLYLEHYTGIPLGKMLTAYPEGVPVGVTARLLPWKTRLNPGVLMHVHLQNRIKGGAGEEKKPAFNQEKQKHIISHLQSIVRGLHSNAAALSTWNNYYGETILSRDYLSKKEKLFRHYLEDLSFRTALDIGANDGHFSQVLSETAGTSILSIDADHACIDRLYSTVKEKNIANVLPLCIDVLHPSAAIGFRNKERASFPDRFRTDLVVALAVAHHLVLSGNIPMPDLAAFLADLTTHRLIIEFVPLEDPKARELIRNKSRYHEPYDAFFFEQCFLEYFLIEKKNKVAGTERILYLMKKKP